jgi:hypothetical protein
MRCGFRWSEPAIGSLPKELRSLLQSACTAVGLLLLLSCSKAGSPPSAFGIQHEITPQPLRVGVNTVTLRVADAAARPITGARINLEADMSHPGMTPVFGEAKEIEAGQYRGQLEFGMAGDWVILLHVELPGGQKLERQIDVRDVRPN